MEKNCQYCGSLFEATRTDALYCCQTCRQYAYLDKRAATTHNVISETGTLQTEKEESIIENEKEQKKKAHDLIYNYSGIFVGTADNMLDGTDEALELDPSRNHISDLPDEQAMIQFRCLLERLLTLSERYAIPYCKFEELLQAYEALINSASFKNISIYSIFRKIILKQRDKLFRICRQCRPGDMINFRIGFVEKAELVGTRYLLATYYPKILFSELDFDNPNL